MATLTKQAPPTLRVVTIESTEPARLDSTSYEVAVEDRPVELAWKEFQLLRFLMLRTGKVFKRADLLRELWPAHRGRNLRLVDVNVRRVRAKLGTASRYIRTVKNVGYGFVVPRGF